MEIVKEFPFEIEKIKSCPLCEGEDIEAFITRTYKVGPENVPLGYFLCKGCTHIFMNPRPTKESYDNLYDCGAYRAMLNAYKTGGPTLQDFAGEATRGHVALDALLPMILKEKICVNSIADVGGSTGIGIYMLAHEIQLIHNLSKAPDEPQKAIKLLNIEPELVFASEGRKMGIANVRYISQGLQYGPFDVVLCIHTLEHQNDVLEFMKELIGLGGDNTIYYFDVPHAEAKKGAYSLWHPQAFTKQSLEFAAEQAGLEVLVHKYQVVRNGINTHCIVAKRKNA